MSITKISPDVVDFDSALVVSPTLTIGDATAEDTKIVFDGNAQDFYIGLDDSADDLLIGLGSTVGTTPAIIIDENVDIGIGASPNYAKVNITNTGTGAQDRALWVECTPASSGSNNNAMVINVGNGNMTNTVMRIHHESPAANQKLLSIDTTGSNTEKFWVDEDGDAYLAGFLEFPNGSGIHFGASAGSGSASEKLDDYEEGTWTPTLVGCDSVDFSSHQGLYIKVGAMVHVQWYSSAFTVSNPETNNARIHGLPFTPKSGYYASASFAHTIAFTNSAVQGWTNSSSPQVYISNEGHTGGNNWSSGSNRYVMMSVVYYTDD